jgi:hypothetical protein
MIKVWPEKGISIEEKDIIDYVSANFTKEKISKLAIAMCKDYYGVPDAECLKYLIETSLDKMKKIYTDSGEYEIAKNIKKFNDWFKEQI